MKAQVGKIYVGESKHGLGIFASKKIPKGDLICEMKGEHINSADFKKISDKGRNCLADPFQIGEDKYLDLEKPYLYFNHSCNPNAGLKNLIDLYALNEIKKGEEIFFDYSTDWYEGFQCNCGNTNCRKYISDFYTIPKKIQKKYRKLGIVGKFVK